MRALDFFLGRRLASSEGDKQKIGLLAGLPAFGLDGLSSSAYGPEAALTILLPAGLIGLHHILPITAVILALLTLLYFSYRQTIATHPVNGGSYTVAKENLGVWPSLFAAAALMIDYVLTVAVGISAGVAALVPAAPHLHRFTLPLCLGILVLITLINLRGTGEAGLTFAFPTYLFILSMLSVLALGVVKTIISGAHPHAIAAPPAVPAATETVGLWLILRSFASGCTAMTGVEAVSNGVSAFKEPTIKNAHRTLTLIVIILAILLGAIAYLARAYQIAAMDQTRDDYQSVLSQLVGAVVGRGWFYDVTMASVLAVLCLSANTSFADFPRLCRLIAKDDFLPRAFAVVGRRLVYSVGVLFLVLASGLLLAAFDGITDKLIPLYAVGAFLAFTLSQAGMVMYWRKQRRRATPVDSRKGKLPIGEGRFGSHVRMWVNGIGAIATGTALVIILAAKFIEGAWITVVAIPTMLTFFFLVHRHYIRIEKQLDCNEPLDLSHNDPPIVLVPISRWDRLAEKSLRFAMQLSPDVVGVHLSNLQGDAAKNEAIELQKLWAKRVGAATATAAGLKPPALDFVQTPYREFTKPVMEQIDRLTKQFPDRLVAVIIPEVVEKHWWQRVLHSRRASQLRFALRNRGDIHVVVVDLPWFIDPPGKSPAGQSKSGK